jgi:hypothetical protein
VPSDHPSPGDGTRSYHAFVFINHFSSRHESLSKFDGNGARYAQTGTRSRNHSNEKQTREILESAKSESLVVPGVLENYRARRDLTVFFLRTGTALSGGFFGIGGSFCTFAAFALNESNSSCLRSEAQNWNVCHGQRLAED